jgi:stress response protein SCP2
VSIYKGRELKQNFGQVDNAFIRAVDARENEMFRYDLSNDKTYGGKCSMIFGEIYRQEGGWNFRAIGTAYETDDFEEILNQQNYL